MLELLILSVIAAFLDPPNSLFRPRPRFKSQSTTLQVSASHCAIPLAVHLPPNQLMFLTVTLSSTVPVIRLIPPGLRQLFGSLMVGGSHPMFNLLTEAQWAQR